MIFLILIPIIPLLCYLETYLKANYPADHLKYAKQIYSSGRQAELLNWNKPKRKKR